jgi:hypothetical protein
MRARLLHGFGYVLSLRGDYARALAVAERAEALSAGSDDPVLMLAACFVHAEVHHLHGRSQVARSWIERGLAIAEPLDMAARDIFTADPHVTLLGMLAIELVRGGLVEQARTHAQRADERARELRQPMTRLVAAWHEALLAVRLATQRVATVADNMQTSSTSFARTGSNGVRLVPRLGGRAKGKAARGSSPDPEAYEENIRLDVPGSSEVLGYAAEALLLAGDRDGAHAASGSTAAAKPRRARVSPQLWLPRCGDRARAWAARMLGTPARRAVEEARAQEAPWLELLALVELCGASTHLSAEDRQRSKHFVDRLSEARDTELRVEQGPCSRRRSRAGESLGRAASTAPWRG